MELKDQVAIVTGASRGLGKAIAKRFLEEGAFVALWALHPGSAEEAAAALDPPGQRTIASKTDITDEIEVQNSVSEVLAKIRENRCLGE